MLLRRAVVAVVVAIVAVVNVKGELTSCHTECRERVVAETQSFVFQMYELWGRRLKRLNKMVKRFIASEKENSECPLYEELVELNRDLVLPALRLYDRLMSQEFVRVREQQELAERTNRAVGTFNELVMEFSIPPFEGHDTPFRDL